MLVLVQPSSEYAHGFKDLVWDYIRSKEVYYMILYKPALEDFSNYIEQLRNHSQGVELPSGWVPYSTFWLYDTEQDIILGNLRIRHDHVEVDGDIGYDIRPSFRSRGYGRLLLEKGLEKAHTFGIIELTVTVDSDNKSSIRVIEQNSGLLSRKFIIENTSIERFEYKFNLSNHNQ